MKKKGIIIGEKLTASPHIFTLCLDEKKQILKKKNKK